VREVAAALPVPVLANGSAASLAQGERCLAFTGCAAVMAGTALLRHPTLFAPLGGSGSEGGGNRTNTGALDGGGVPCVSLSTALWNCRAYLAAARECWTAADARNLRMPLMGERPGAIHSASSSAADSDHGRGPSSDCPCVNGRPRAEVCRDHLLALLQNFLMDTEHLDLWSLLSAK
jgi:tRNA-dihydrouridine synthase